MATDSGVTKLNKELASLAAELRRLIAVPLPEPPAVGATDVDWRTLPLLNFVQAPVPPGGGAAGGRSAGRRTAAKRHTNPPTANTTRQGTKTLETQIAPPVQPRRRSTS